MTLTETEAKWQAEWAARRVYEADPQSGRPKIFITVPYAYMNGPLHIGHAFTYTRADVYARFKRMQGFNVLFPVAWHWTGETVLGQAVRLAQGDPQVRRAFVEIDKVPEDVVARFTDPAYMAAYYTDVAREAVQRIGFAMDLRRQFTTADPGYSRLITWQYLRLRELGYVVLGTHPVVWCPHDASPTGDHDRLTGEGVSPGEFTLVKFELDGTALVAATFRPETIFGVTNVWVHPEGEYVEATVDGERWLISRACAGKLGEQKHAVRVERTLSGRDLLGRFCRAPLVGRSIPILPATLVDVETGTGVVYSVPAHAPYDYLGLRDLQRQPPAGLEQQVRQVQPISIIEVPGYGALPAQEAVEALGVTDQLDRRADQATQTVYKREYSQGRMKANCGSVAGLPVSEAKTRIATELQATGRGSVMLELPDPVVCRCGTRCIVKILENQWFLKYADPEWKVETKAVLARARVYPPEARQWFEATVDWLRNWACARKTGMGTKVPWDPDWIVETLSDSTIYMSFYTVAKFLNAGVLGPEQLTPGFFDYVFYGRGTVGEIARSTGIAPSVLEQVRQEFEYWYPVDLRNSAKELIPNHLTFYVFHHVALFPAKHHPRMIGVNGMMQIEGAPMHKSKGSFVPLLEAVHRYGADATRLTLMLRGEGLDDPDWRHREAEEVRAKLEALLPFLPEFGRSGSERRVGVAERWLLSRLQRRVASVQQALEELRTRTAAQTAFYDVWNDIRWYLRRVREPHAGTVRQVARIWVRLLAPFIPHFAEEMYAQLGGEGFVIDAPWPQPEPGLLDERAEVAEWWLEQILEDAKNILKLVKPVKGVAHVYVADEWRRGLLTELVRARANGQETQAVVRAFLERVGVAPQQAGPLVPKLTRLINDVGEEVVVKLNRTGLPDELAVLREAQGFVESELGLRLQIYRADGTDVYDPQTRARLALPLKPAIYVE